MNNAMYRYKFSTNIIHSIETSGEYHDKHLHTIDTIIYIKESSKNVFLKYNSIEDDVNKYLSIFAGAFINEIEPFDVIVPTIENIGKEFYKNIDKILNEKGFELLKLEISDIPTRAFVIRGGN